MTTLRAPKIFPKESNHPAPSIPKRNDPAVIPSEGASTPTMSYEQIAARAYTLFLGRGGRPGSEWEDWFQAEADLLREREQADRAAGQ